MDFQEFIIKIEAKGYGIGGLNTYHLNGINYCYLMISEKGNIGKFHKREFKAFELNQNLQFMFDMLGMSND